ncbi:hypothetical protein RRG08_014131 [Elysia crispata]|uniref:Uncharacterized protein n=1 Tax=Elysia crispata TaxID=231223 RepID=A0AAE1B0M3_9GAST|nr:hypothetical protein RRG08_014131 [Elysia crispata]
MRKINQLFSVISITALESPQNHKNLTQDASHQHNYLPEIEKKRNNFRKVKQAKETFDSCCQLLIFPSTLTPRPNRIIQLSGSEA